jgi:hypothetical protein
VPLLSKSLTTVGTEAHGGTPQRKLKYIGVPSSVRRAVINHSSTFPVCPLSAAIFLL